MPSKPSGRPNGRTSKEKNIDWDKVDQLLIAGCLGTEIAPHFDMHPETFYDHVLRKYGICFSEYSFKKKSQGDSLLRAKQFEKALKGENTLLIWLGKNRLNQRDSEDKSANAPNHETIKQLLEGLANLNVNEQKANTQLPAEQQATEYLGGGGEIREDVQLDTQTD